MWLILCGSNDVSALWAYQGLKTRGLEPLELVSTEMLAYSLRWEHRLKESGINTKITLADGRIISNDNIQGVLNRLLAVPSEHLYMASESDRNYAIQELTAFFMSWLYALPQPVLNLPTPQGLSGQWRHLSEWAKLAAKAGLPTPIYQQSSHDPIQEIGCEKTLMPASTVIVVGGYVVGASAPPEIVRGCQRLAKVSNTALLGIEFTHTFASGWTFKSATPFPDLRLGGSALLDVLALVLQGKWEEIE